MRLLFCRKEKIVIIHLSCLVEKQKAFGSLTKWCIYIIYQYTSLNKKSYVILLLIRIWVSKNHEMFIHGNPTISVMVNIIVFIVHITEIYCICLDGSSFYNGKN